VRPWSSNWYGTSHRALFYGARVYQNHPRRSSQRLFSRASIPLMSPAPGLSQCTCRFFRLQPPKTFSVGLRLNVSSLSFLRSPCEYFFPSLSPHCVPVAYLKRRFAQFLAPCTFPILVASILLFHWCLAPCDVRLAGARFSRTCIRGAPYTPASTSVFCAGWPAGRGLFFVRGYDVDGLPKLLLVREMFGSPLYVHFSSACVVKATSRSS